MPKVSRMGILWILVILSADHDVARTERTSSKLAFREKSITEQWCRTTNHQVNNARFSQRTITPVDGLLIDC